MTTINRLTGLATGMDTDQIVKDMLINILSICYIQNIDLNDIFKMEVIHYEEV